MREGWGTAKLSDLCEFRNGLWKGKKPPFVHVGVIRNTNFRADGSLDDSDIAFLDVEQRQFEKRSLQYGDLILEKSGGGPKQPVGRVVLFDKKDGLYSFSNFTSVVRVLDSSRLDFRYLHRVLYWYYISGVTESMQRRSTGIRNLEFSAYKSLDIPLPPLPEQKRIVAILDEAFAGIATAVANTEKNLANARELFESYLNAVFSQSHEGWMDRPLRDFSASVSTGPFGSMLHKSDYVSKGVPLVNPINIIHGTIQPDERKMIGPETKARLQSYVLQAGDIVIARRGEIGRCAVVTEEQSGWVCGTGCFFVRPTNIVDPNFLANMLRSARYRSELERLSTGATMLNLSNTALSNLRISVPDLVQQKAILGHISELSMQCQEIRYIYQQKLAALAELKQSLLQKAFSGELTTASQDEMESALA
ncbi:MAG: restriction endonuclease subunit S [Chromatiales bacterium]|nr:restriction endonuclease subunit S [Chromatiales bacterium]